jgi:hypothetical protein
MKTVEDIQRERGLDVREVDDDARVIDLRTCGFNPSKEGEKTHDCGQTARWHARVSSERVPTGLTLIACDSHLGVIQGYYGEALLGLHEFVEACGLMGWWIEHDADAGSTCLTEEQGIRLGYLTYVPD